MVGLMTLPVRVETDLAAGLPSFSIVGLPDAAIREARDRVRAAIHNSGFEFPQRRITVNLAPADLPKESGRFDLPIALGILAASDQIPRDQLSAWEFVGELSLSGVLLPVRGAFALVMGAGEANNERSLLCPVANREEASLSEWTRLGFAHDLRQVADFLAGRQSLLSPLPLPVADMDAGARNSHWSTIKGQTQAKRAAVIALAGRHNLLMFGPPGVGKSMIASEMAALLPSLTIEQAQSLARVVSLTEPVQTAHWRSPPYRCPHHTTPARALIGGGQPLRAGEISFAHQGILFLDEFPEFSREALEALREPLETQEVHIVRVRERLTFPADVMLVAAMNPCPCGYFGVAHAGHPCQCTPDHVQRYRGKISGPLLDRFDMVIGLEMPSLATSSLSASESSGINTVQDITEQINAAQARQLARQGRLNSRCAGSDIEAVAACDPAATALLTAASEKYGWSLRGWHRTLRVARTIADIESVSAVGVSHISEAIALRRALEIQTPLPRTRPQQPPVSQARP